MHLNIINYGKGAKPLVFFHGWGFDHHIWSLLIPQISHDFDIYLIDLPGFGGSSYMDWELFKFKLLQNLPQTFALVGWSMGGLWATRLALECPEAISHVLNVASSPCFIKDAQWPGLEVSAFQAFYGKIVADPDLGLERFIRSQLRTSNLENISNLTPKLNVNLSLQKSLDILLEWDLRRELIALKMPVSYLFGTHDVISPRGLMHAMQLAYPQFKYVLFEQAAHIPFLSHQAKFIELVEQFFL